ncbi:ankyrin repeat and SAM domain-containing protein 6 [Anopheles gambiae]|uniref:ankyrin repeat and SAM domain-containing protein 6 n=1 Tax=Anopheles gambiae TaxID=7165 RepID=UPI002AC944D3|nr:ankyrin repeat and SAM domain-containing protein 6 [Anopheles gambiae]
MATTKSKASELTAVVNPATALQPSPIIQKISPSGNCTADVSFEAYKQPKNRSKRRSFSPMVHQDRIPSPELSPIELSQTFRISPRMNTPRATERQDVVSKTYLLAKPIRPQYKRSPKEDEVYVVTPVAKRELEHRICVSNILKDMGLEKYIRIFTKEEINFDVFLTLCEKDLHEIGIHCQEDIEKILAKIADYNMGVEG